MIKSLTAINHLGDRIVLELMRPDKTGFVVKSIEGLGPVKANINTTKSATTDGAFYNSASMDMRDITIVLEYFQVAGEKVEDIRQRSYKYFPNKKKVSLIVETDNRTVWTEGYVEDNTPVIFSSKCYSTIVVRCPDPNLYSIKSKDTLLYGIEPLFEFPLENIPVNEATTELGEIIHKSSGNIYYDGDCDVGLTITLDATGDVTNVVIAHDGTDEQMVIDTSRLKNIVNSDKFIAGDTVVINTVIGSKSIHLIRDGVRYNILNCLDRGSTWFTLSKGDNFYSYTASAGDEYLRFRASNKIVYYGV